MTSEMTDVITYSNCQHTDDHGTHDCTKKSNAATDMMYTYTCECETTQNNIVTSKNCYCQQLSGTQPLRAAAELPRLGKGATSAQQTLV
jgi:ferredoxin-thioredoxin reductase catalytic subunit